MQIDPYVPGEQPAGEGIVKLNANENPYPPSPCVEKALHSFPCGGLSLYPDADGTRLKQTLAAYHGLQQSQVFLGNGSDDVIALCFQAFFRGKRPIRYPDLTYSFYPVWSSLFQVPYETVPLTGGYHIDARGFDGPSGGVILPNPNAPTGIGEDKDFFIDLLERHQDCVVIIDEAYVDFGGYSVVELLAQYENLLVVRTFSKSRSLAGLRVGYALGSEVLIQTLEAVKNSYNSYTLDSVAMAAAVASVEDDAYFRCKLEQVIKSREAVTAALRGMGFTVLQSKANFILMNRDDVPAQALFAFLKTKNIFVRYFNLPRVENHLRVTIGTQEQMALFLTAVEAFIRQLSI